MCYLGAISTKALSPGHLLRTLYKYLFCMLFVCVKEFPHCTMIANRRSLVGRTLICSVQEDPGGEIQLSEERKAFASFDTVLSSTNSFGS